MKRLIMNYKSISGKSHISTAVLLFLAVFNNTALGGAGVVFQGSQGPGVGKHIVFVVGDEEYRGEESMPMLAKILAHHHGFKCTVLFATNKKTGLIDPGTVDNIPGLEQLATADLMVMFLRFRELPDSQMKHIIDYTNSGKPIMGLRTSTHAFYYKKYMTSPYAKYSFRNHKFKGGYGRQVFGETWINHYGHHQVESTRGIIADGMQAHPILKGVKDIWGESDVYGLTTLHGNCTPLVMGVVLKGMKPTDKPNMKKPPIPVVWTKTYTGDKGKTARIFTTTMGHSFDFLNEDFRRLLVNGCYWSVGIEKKIPKKANVIFIGQYTPSKIGFGKHKKSTKASDHKIKP